MTGLILAYRSSFLRRATIGEEYPVIFLDGELLEISRCYLITRDGLNIPNRPEQGAITFLEDSGQNERASSMQDHQDALDSLLRQSCPSFCE